MQLKYILSNSTHLVPHLRVQPFLWDWRMPHLEISILDPIQNRWNRWGIVLPDHIICLFHLSLLHNRPLVSCRSQTHLALVNLVVFRKGLLLIHLLETLHFPQFNKHLKWQKNTWVPQEHNLLTYKIVGCSHKDWIIIAGTMITNKRQARGC